MQGVIDDMRGVTIQHDEAVLIGLKTEEEVNTTLLCFNASHTFFRDYIYVDIHIQGVNGHTNGTSETVIQIIMRYSQFTPQQIITSFSSDS